MRVLVTGSTGAIGGAVCSELQDHGHEVRGFDRAPNPRLADAHVGDLTDAAAVRAAMTGVDALVHLAATPDESDFLTDILPNNIIGSYHVLEAAAACDVKRLVLTSSCQLVQLLINDPARTEPVRIEDGYGTQVHYGLSKIWLEQAGRMYASRHRQSVICIRPGHLPRKPSTFDSIGARPKAAAWYLSMKDAGRAFRLAVESDRPEPGQAATIFLTSRPPAEPIVDLTPAREVIGYEPQHTWPEGREGFEPYWQIVERDG